MPKTIGGGLERLFENIDHSSRIEKGVVAKRLDDIPGIKGAILRGIAKLSSRRLEIGSGTTKKIYLVDKKSFLEFIQCNKKEGSFPGFSGKMSKLLKAMSRDEAIINQMSRDEAIINQSIEKTFSDYDDSKLRESLNPVPPSVVPQKYEVVTQPKPPEIAVFDLFNGLKEDKIQMKREDFKKAVEFLKEDISVLEQEQLAFTSTTFNSGKPDEYVLSIKDLQEIFGEDKVLRFSSEAIEIVEKNKEAQKTIQEESGASPKQAFRHQESHLAETYQALNKELNKIVNPESVPKEGMSKLMPLKKEEKLRDQKRLEIQNKKNERAEKHIEFKRKGEEVLQELDLIDKQSEQEFQQNKEKNMQLRKDAEELKKFLEETKDK